MESSVAMMLRNRRSDHSPWLAMARVSRLLFVLERDLVGAIGRGQRGDDDADDRDRDDDAERHDDAEARAIPRRRASDCPAAQPAPGASQPTRFAPQLVDRGDARRKCLLLA